ncbi:hypothetical protein CW706_00670 [Candidatus Bathyarchaeota archaeon]|nr:MAG: hypothetical protein CW706_00670 [Candidatus Bathyarchaeota archaeon]
MKIVIGVRIFMSDSRIVIIGAGSHFTLGIFGDFFRVDDLWGSELVLMDIDEERLRAVSKILMRIVEHEKVQLKIKATTSLKEALENADFIITTIRSGGLEILKNIIEIPLRLGTVEVVGDTVGPSGILKAMMEVPAIVEIAERIRDISPKAILINFTNPMTPICEAAEKAAHIRVIGLCGGFRHMQRLASDILKISESERLDVSAAGINHFTWTVDLSYGDESVYAEFLKGLLLEENEQIVANHRYFIGRDLYRLFGVPPTLSDRHTSEFFHYLYDWINHPRYGPILKEISGYIDYENKTLSREVFKKKRKRMKNLLRMSRGLEDAKITPSKEYAIDIVSAVSNRKKARLLAANIPNDGSLEEVSLGRFVEMPIRVSGDCIAPLRRFRLPKPIVSLLNLHLDKFQLLVDGILEREKDLILQAMALDPLTPSPDKAEDILDEFIKHASLYEYFKKTTNV